MKIVYEGFSGANHSWSLVAQGLCREFDKLGHTVHMKSTNGYQYFPDDLRHLVRNSLDTDYNLEFSYTAMKNFLALLNHSKTSRKIGIWSFEFDGKGSLPSGFAKNYKYCDILCPPSQFAKQVFLNSGIPDNVMKVLPHGVDLQKFKNAKPYPLKTKKNIKIISTVFQPHLRKNLDGMLDIYGRSFKKSDDVVYVIKVIDKKPEQPFEICFSDIFKKFQAKYPNHAEIEVIKNYVSNIEELYAACNVHFCLSHAECFSFPCLEALASGLINISSNYGGQLDFLNKNNSLLVDGNIVKANPKALYYESKNNTLWFQPNTDDAVNKLRHAVYNYYPLKEKLLHNIENYLKPYEWNNIAKQILEI